MPKHGGGNPNDKPNNFNLAVKKLMHYLNKYKFRIIFALIFSAFSSVLAIISPKRLEKLINTIIAGIITGIDIDKVKEIMFALIIIYVLSAIFDYLEKYLMVDATNKFAKELREKISHKINKLPLKYFDTHTSGDILSRVTNDIDTVSQNLNNSLGTFVSAITLLVGCLIMMFKTNWIMALTSIFSSIIGLVLMMIILSKAQKYFVMRQEELGKLNGHIEEIYSSQTLVKAYNGEKNAWDKFAKLNESVYTCNLKSEFLGGMMPSIMGFIGNFGYVAVCVVGALLTMKGTISFGVIVAFIMYVRLFTSPLMQIAQGMTNMQMAAAAGKRAFDFLDEEDIASENDCKATDISKVNGAVKFRNVCFGYSDDPEKAVIKNFSANIKPGQKVAIVGPTGAGKTTLVNLLMRFYEPLGGSILIDGVPTDHIKREDIHDMFAMVLQDTWLFDGTIRENLVYNKQNVSDDELMRACHACGIGDYIESLPGKLDARIDENTNISAGQKQLFTIARAMIRNSPMLILDEATSSVDTRTELLAQRAMDKLTENRTSFVIAHRLSTIKNADLILVLKDGNVIEQGSHSELLAKGGFYSELYNSQFEQTD